MVGEATVGKNCLIIETARIMINRRSVLVQLMECMRQYVRGSWMRTDWRILLLHYLPM